MKGWMNSASLKRVALRQAQSAPRQDIEGGPRASGNMSRRGGVGADRFRNVMCSDARMEEGASRMPGVRIAFATVDANRQRVAQGHSTLFLNGLSAPIGAASKTPEAPHITWS